MIGATRDAFRAAGYELDPEGTLRPSSLENLVGTHMTEALSLTRQLGHSGVMALEECRKLGVDYTGWDLRMFQAHLRDIQV